MNLVIATVISLLIGQLKPVNAQNLGFEIGTAGVENYDAGILNLGFSINVPLTQRISCDLSYYHWQGEDGNYKHAILKPEDWTRGSGWTFFGDNGLNLTMFYKIYGKDKFSISLGSGLGRYQKKEFNIFNDTVNFYLSTFSISTLLNYKISKRRAIYGKVLVNTTSLTVRPDWGIFNLGIELTDW
jgi:hypothetical protein